MHTCDFLHVFVQQTFESIWPLSLRYILEFLVFVGAIYWNYCDLDLYDRFIHDLQ